MGSKSVGRTVGYRTRPRLRNVFHRPGLSDVADILIVAVIIYYLLMMTRQTRASAVLKGLVLLLVATFVS